MERFQLIEVDGKTPRERGIQYGQQAQKKIMQAVEGYRQVFERSTGKNWQEICDMALSFSNPVQQLMPEVLEEAEGIAQGAGVPFGELMVLNCRYELTAAPPPECTVAAILPQAAAQGKTYLVKNWDYRHGVLEHIVLLRIRQADGTVVFGLAEAGQMLREGFNSHRIGLVNSMIRSVRDQAGDGVPVTFLRRKALTCSSFEAARNLLINAPRSVSNNMLLASCQRGESRALDIEAYPGGANELQPAEGIITHANHFVQTPHLEGRDCKKDRDERLRHLLAQRRGSIDAAYLIECMKDHAGYPESICAHNVEPITPENDFMTVASLIINLTDATAEVCVGPPCECQYHHYDLE